MVEGDGYSIIEPNFCFSRVEFYGVRHLLLFSLLLFWYSNEHLLERCRLESSTMHFPHKVLSPFLFELALRHRHIVTTTAKTQPEVFVVVVVVFWFLWKSLLCACPPLCNLVVITYPEKYLLPSSPCFAIALWSLLPSRIEKRLSKKNSFRHLGALLRILMLWVSRKRQQVIDIMIRLDSSPKWQKKMHFFDFYQKLEWNFMAHLLNLLL